MPSSDFWLLKLLQEEEEPVPAAPPSVLEGEQFRELLAVKGREVELPEVIGGAGEQDAPPA